MLLLSSQTDQAILYVETLADQPRHFDKLLRLWEAVRSHADANLDLVVNFNYCEFLGHSGVACLGGLAQLVMAQGGRVRFDWQTLPPKNLCQPGPKWLFV